MNDELIRLEQVIVNGNLASLTPKDRLYYYDKVCSSVGLNPFTKPFEYIQIDGKLRLYALKGATDQLRSINNISIKIATKIENDVFIVSASAKKDDRVDEDIGCVAVKGLLGKALSNAMMIAVTKAKRRVTLSICGLGMLDETEIETIPKNKAIPVNVNSETGEINNNGFRSADREDIGIPTENGQVFSNIKKIWKTLPAAAMELVMEELEKNYKITDRKEIGNMELEAMIAFESFMKEAKGGE